MAALTIRNEALNLRVPQTDDDSLTKVLTGIDRSIIERGGFWFRTQLENDVSRLLWMPAQGTVITAEFDDEPPALALDMTIQSKP